MSLEGISFREGGVAKREKEEASKKKAKRKRKVFIRKGQRNAKRKGRELIIICSTKCAKKLVIVQSQIQNHLSEFLQVEILQSLDGENFA